MKKSPLCGILSKASWVITALVSVNQGLHLFQFNLFATEFFRNNLSGLHQPLLLLIGAAGVWSLFCFFTCND